MNEQTLIIAAIAAGIALPATAYIGYRWYLVKRDIAELDARAAEARAGDDDEGHTLEFERPEMSGGLFGLVKVWLHRRKAKKMARKGYVKWYKIDGSLQPPEWVKPTFRVGGEPAIKDGDDYYLFPDDGLTLDSQSGARVAVHHRGEPEPLNLSKPNYATIDGKGLRETINRAVESDAPGLFDRLDIDPAQALIYGTIGFVMVAAAAQQLM